MRYLGGKHKIGEEISKKMVKLHPPLTVDGYLEPFCGSLGVFKYMTQYNYKTAIASDIQPDLIEMWKQVQNNTIVVPEDVDETEYNRLKLLNNRVPCAKKAMVGFFLSFGGKYFGGFAPKWEKKDGKDYLQTLKNGIEKMKPLIQRENVFFQHSSYLEWKPKNMVIYCDPPYKNTEKYTANAKHGDFDHDLFWDTMRLWSKDNYVYVSEQSAPPDFKSLWSHQKKRTLSNNLKNRKVKIEHLYTLSKTIGKKSKSTKNSTKTPSKKSTKSLKNSNE